MFVSQNKQMNEEIEHKNNHLDTFLLITIVLIATPLVLHSIGQRSIWLDEAFSIKIANYQWKTFAQYFFTHDANMALYYLLLKFWIKLSSNESFLRLLSALFAIASTIAVFFLGKLLYDRETGFYASIMMVLNPFFITYAQETRSYSLLLFFSVLSTYFFICVTRRATWKMVVIYATISALSCYAHLFGFLVIASHIVTMPLIKLSEKATKKMYIAYVIFTVLISPLIAAIYMSQHNTVNWIKKPHLIDVFRLLKDLCGGSVYVFCFIFVFVFLSCIAYLKFLRKDDTSFFKHEFLILLFLFLMPILSVFLVSMIKPLFVSRYFIICIPPIVLLASMGITRTLSKKHKICLVLLYVIISFSAISSYYRDSTRYGENWREATRFIVTESREQDGILFYLPFTRTPFEFYLYKFNKGELEKNIIKFPKNNFRPSISDTDLDFLYQDSELRYHRVWLILSHHNMSQKRRDTWSNIVSGLRRFYPSEIERYYSGIQIILFSMM
jgi:uncharacterized membrane protein